jgi:hypothetical protein
VAKVTIVNVDLPRRELDLVVAEFLRKPGKPSQPPPGRGEARDGREKRGPRGGGAKRHGTRAEAGPQRGGRRGPPSARSPRPASGSKPPKKGGGRGRR